MGDEAICESYKKIPSWTQRGTDETHQGDRQRNGSENTEQCILSYDVLIARVKE